MFGYPAKSSALGLSTRSSAKPSCHPKSKKFGYPAKRCALGISTRFLAKPLKKMSLYQLSANFGVTHHKGLLRSAIMLCVMFGWLLQDFIRGQYGNCDILKQLSIVPLHQGTFAFSGYLLSVDHWQGSNMILSHLSANNLSDTLHVVLVVVYV